MSLYETAASVLRKARQKRGNLKNLCSAAKTSCNKRQLYALLCSTLAQAPWLKDVLEQSQLLQAEPQVNQELALLGLHDLLIGGGIKCGGVLKFALRRQKAAIDAAVANVCKSHNAPTLEDLRQRHQDTTQRLPRWARINLCRGTEAELLARLTASGFHRHDDAGLKLQAQDYRFDRHIPQLLEFAATADFHDHELVTSGALILQDKASCMPAIALAPPHGATCLDACAAPGNKTSHLAALVGPQGKVIAFEKDPRRFKVLQAMLRRAGATQVTPHLGDFLQADPADPAFAAVTHILCDPSCSGSGMVQRQDDAVEAIFGEEHDPSSDSRRLVALANFQKQIVCHAMRFPNVHRVSYSTCSIHEEENEDVVAAILKEHPEFELVPALPDFPGRGRSTSLSNASACVRTVPEEHRTHGFFVAVFQRSPDAHQASVGSPAAVPTAGSAIASSPEGITGRTDADERPRKKEKLEQAQPPAVSRSSIQSKHLTGKKKQKHRRSKQVLKSITT